MKLEPDEGKLSSPVLRGLGGSDSAQLPDQLKVVLMRKFMIFGLIFMLLATISPAQQKSDHIAAGEARISKEKPTVYISFERYGKAIDSMQAHMLEAGKTTKDIEKGKDIWLRLHNNTRWAITFPTSSLYLGKRVTPYRLSDGSGALGLNDNIVVSIEYNIQDADGKRIPNGIDMYFSSWLPPGHSVLFSVKREHLSQDRYIYVPIGYEWESEKGHIRGGEPLHRVEFYNYSLPEKEH